MEPSPTCTTVALDGSTWAAFADLVDRNNGVYGGCWCIGWHLARGMRGTIDHRSTKEQLVRGGEAHAALVLDEDGVAQGWAQFGRAAELPGIKHRREYDKDAPPLPDWRLACIFVDPRHRGQGVARAAVEGALGLMATAGGGLVEAIAEETAGRSTPGRFLFSATAELLEEFGFGRVRKVVKHAWILGLQLQPQPREAGYAAVDSEVSGR